MIDFDKVYNDYEVHKENIHHNDDYDDNNNAAGGGDGINIIDENGDSDWTDNTVHNLNLIIIHKYTYINKSHNA